MPIIYSVSSSDMLCLCSVFYCHSIISVLSYIGVSYRVEYRLSFYHSTIVFVSFCHFTHSLIRMYLWCAECESKLIFLKKNVHMLHIRNSKGKQKSFPCLDSLRSWFWELKFFSLKLAVRFSFLPQIVFFLLNFEHWGSADEIFTFWNFMFSMF